MRGGEGALLRVQGQPGIHKEIQSQRGARRHFSPKKIVQSISIVPHSNQGLKHNKLNMMPILYNYIFKASNINSCLEGNCLRDIFCSTGKKLR